MVADKTAELQRNAAEVRAPRQDGHAEQADYVEVLQQNFAGGERSGGFQCLEVMGNN